MSYSHLPLIRNLRAARKAASLTQQQLADSLGMSPLNYGRIERGERAPTLPRLAQIADLLGISAYDLLAGCFPGTPSVHADAALIEQLISSCSAQGRRLIHDVAWLIAGDYDI